MLAETAAGMILGYVELTQFYLCKYLLTVHAITSHWCVHVRSWNAAVVVVVVVVVEVVVQVLVQVLVIVIVRVVVVVVVVVASSGS